VQSIGVVLCLHDTQPPVPLDALRASVERTWKALVRLLEAYPAIRLSVHLSGMTLDAMETYQPELLERVVGLAAEGRIEVIGGLWGGGVLPALPERDIIGQVQAMTRWWRAHQDVRLRGAWLPYHGWDPSAARVLGRLGFQYTVLEASQFTPPVAAEGYVVTEREGHGLALFVADPRLAGLVAEGSAEAVIQAIAARAEAGARCVTILVPGDLLGQADPDLAEGATGEGGWLPALFEALTANAHWLKLVGFGTALDRMRPAERAWPPPSVCLPVAVAALGGARGAAWMELVTEARRSGDPLLQRAASFLRPGAWEQLLGAVPELNRLHKRMLLVSLEVLRLRNALRDGKGERDPRFSLLEDATLALYKGQVGAAYVLGMDVGAQDGAVRDAAWAALVSAEHMVAAAMGEAERMRIEQVDYDCDGRAEVIVRTPVFGAIVSPASGGALVELDGWALPGNLLNVRTRREEPEHAELLRTEHLPRLLEGAVTPTRDEAPGPEGLPDVRELPPLRVAEDRIVDRLHYDRHVRASFLDHFLGPEATPENFARGRYPEAGDFAGAEYQLLQAEENDQGSILVSLARDGGVNEGTALRLVRVAKRYVFQRDLPVVDVRYEVANRYHEPVRGRFGVELNLNLDSTVQPATFLTSGGARYPVTEPGEILDAEEVAFVGAARGFRLTIQAQPSGRLWYHPIETASRSPKGMRRHFQGVCLLFWWPIELWGLERRRIDLSLALEA
jgi:hypothetical protein